MQAIIELSFVTERPVCLVSRNRRNLNGQIGLQVGGGYLLNPPEESADAEILATDKIYSL